MANSPKAAVAAQDAPAAAESAPAPAGRRKTLVIAVAVLVLAGAAGGAWLVLKGRHAAEGEAAARPARKEIRHADKGVPPVFLALEPFVVNLHGASAQADQFLQTDITLRVADASVVEEIKQHMPEVRNRVLMLLSGRTAQELLTPQGKSKLAEDVRMEVTLVVDPDAPRPAAAEPVPARAEGTKAGTAAAETGDKAAAQDEAAPAPAAAEDEAQSSEDARVRSVLFTSFIIQ